MDNNTRNETYFEQTVGGSPTQEPEDNYNDNNNDTVWECWPQHLDGVWQIDRWFDKAKSIPQPNRMDKELVSAVNRAEFQEWAPADALIMNVKRNTRGTITAITHRNSTPEMALLYPDVNLKTASSVDKGIIDVKRIKSWGILKTHTVLLVWYLGQGTEGLHKIFVEFQEEYNEVRIPAQVRWLSNPCTVSEWEQRAEVNQSSVFFVVRRMKGAQRPANTGVSTARVWYKVKLSWSRGPESLCELCGRWGHIERKYSNHLTNCGNCAGSHQSGEDRFNIVRYMAKPVASCSHKQEKFVSCNGNHIASSGICAQQTNAVSMGQQRLRL